MPFTFAPRVLKAPHMSLNEIDCLSSYLFPTDTVLEWGTGGSTIYFAPKVAYWYGIEHDTSWYFLVNKNLREQNIPNALTNLVPVPLAKSVLYYDKTNVKKDFEKYANYVHELNVPYYDIILIDGRNRIECAKQALEYTILTTKIFVHDWHREYYHKILKLDYKLIELVDTLAVLEAK